MLKLLSIELYWYGKGTPVDFTEGLKWARDAATLGNADGEYGVAMAYAFGLGVDRDPAAGLKWLEKAAGDGSREADAWLAARYLYGDGVPTDTNEGLKYLTAAADKGLARALVALAQISDEGAFGQPKNSHAALSFQERAAQLRFFPAQIDLALSLRPWYPIRRHLGNIGDDDRLQRWREALPFFRLAFLQQTCSKRPFLPVSGTHLTRRSTSTNSIRR